MRINYWTTASFEPSFEAVSKEVFELAASFPGSLVFGINANIKMRWGRNPAHIGFHPAFDPALRLLIPLIEGRGDINHIYSEPSPWTFLKTLRRKPSVLTIASEKGELNQGFLDRVDAITVQTEQMMERLSINERWANKTSLIYPGVDLGRFRRLQKRSPGRTPRILFATFPRTHEELAARGVLFLIEMAQKHPQLEFDLLARPWTVGDSATSFIRGRIHEQKLNNVRLIEGLQRDMSRLYSQCDFVLIPYTTLDGGKEFPLSLVEALACGLPALVSEVAPCSRFVERNGCGASFSLDASSFGLALDEAMRDYAKLSEAATNVASVHFDREVTIRRFSALYEAISN